MNEAIDAWTNEGGAMQVEKPKSKNKNESKSDSEKLWAALHGAFDHLNLHVFNGKLDRNLVILNCSRKNARTLGFYRNISWANGSKEEKAEISLNPDAMHGRSIDKIYSTLCHEMFHFWQDCFGKSVGKRGYHNKEWAEAMEKGGLMPVSSDGTGKKTGMRMTHEIIPGGLFDLAMDSMPEEYKIPFLGLPPGSKKAKTGYQKWVCPKCKQLARAKETAKIACIPCSESENKIIQFVCTGF